MVMGKWLTWAFGLLLSMSATLALSAPVAEAEATAVTALSIASRTVGAALANAPCSNADGRYGLPVADAEEEDSHTSDDVAGLSGASMVASASAEECAVEGSLRAPGRFADDDQRRYLRTVRSSLAAP